LGRGVFFTLAIPSILIWAFDARCSPASKNEQAKGRALPTLELPVGSSSS
jgi:hypothetical protein